MSFPRPEGQAIADGEWIPAERLCLDLSDPAVQSGLGVFETIAVREGVCLDLVEHAERFAHSAKVVGVAIPEQPVVEHYARDVARYVEGGYGWLKIVGFRPDRIAVFAGTMDPAEEGRAVTAIVLPWRRSLHEPLTGVKSTSYAGFTLGLEAARSAGADEGLFLNSRGHLMEGCASNLFVVKGRRIFTPSLGDGILAGVTRAKAIEAVRASGLIVHEGKLRLKRLRDADEAFLTSSLKGVRPLIRVDRRPIGRGEPGPVTRIVAQMVAEIRLRAVASSRAAAMGDA